MTLPNTENEYYEVISFCKKLFDNKNKDYGTAWRILRLPSITDQIFIKAQRIRSIQEKGEQKVLDNISSEFVGIINYCIIALIQLGFQKNQSFESVLNTADISHLYDQNVALTLDLLRNKNHDYGEAWRNMRITSMTDLILMKLLRVKQIEDNLGKTLASEGVEANYQDIMNYAIFCLIKMK